MKWLMTFIKRFLKIFNEDNQFFVLSLYVYKHNAGRQFCMKNIFLTGPNNIGKTTVINQVIKRLNLNETQFAGFNTLPYIKNKELKGFYIEPINYPYYIPDKGNRLIGYSIKEKWIPVKETFDKYGVRILNYCLKSPANLVIMDELGFFEMQAIKFQYKVFDILSSSKSVLGIIKPISIPFIDTIRNRDDVEIFEVTSLNRDDLSNKISKIMKTEI